MTSAARTACTGAILAEAYEAVITASAVDTTIAIDSCVCRSTKPAGCNPSGGFFPRPPLDEGSLAYFNAMGVMVPLVLVVLKLTPLLP